MCRLRRPDRTACGARDQRVPGGGGRNANAAAAHEPAQQREPLESVARLLRWLRMLDINLPSRRVPSAASCCRPDLFKSLAASPGRPSRFASSCSYPPNPSLRFRFESRRILSPVLPSLRRWRLGTSEGRGEVCARRTDLTDRVRSNPNIAWKASLTCRPIPTCTPARGSQTALMRRAPRRRDGIRNTRGAAPRNGIDFAPRGRLSSRAPREPRRGS